jgi:hypothetical protein
VRIYVQGKNPGFREESEWPLARAQLQALYLSPQGLSPSAAPNAGSVFLDYPRNDFQRDIGSVEFATEPLATDLEVTGPIKLVLFVSSDQRDADVCVTLSERSAGCQTTVVTRGWQKASQRALDPELSTPLRPFHPHTSETPLSPGEIVEIEIEIWPTSWRFAQGHQIVLAIATGDRTHHYGFKAGRDTYHFGGAQPSRLILPVVPA